MSWALKRQLIFITTLLLLIAGFAYLVVIPHIKNIPTCTDGKQNGDEKGIDCGGSCEKACLFEVDEVSVLWSRVFKVVEGRYNAITYLENHNPTNASRKIKYRFRFADKDNIYIGKRDGETVIPPSGKFAVFEPAIDFANSIPVYVTFEFTELPFWENVPEDKLKDIKIFVSDIKLQNSSTNPHLMANIKNTSMFIIPDIDVIAILYDEEGNAITASKTYIEKLGRGEEVALNFTWPEPIFQNVIVKEIIPTYNIFEAKLK